jgi:starch-binding outer membrane protein SusE/F
MKHSIKFLGFVALVLFAVSSCKKTDKKVVLTDLTPKNTLSASNTDITCDSSKIASNVSATSLSWTKPNYGFDAGVIYALEIATKEENLGLLVPGSTVIKTDSQGKIFLNYPNKVLGSFFTYDKLNNFLLNNGYTDSVFGKLYCRIKNTISYTDVPANKDLPVSYSNVLVLNVKPYIVPSAPLRTLYVPGTYQGAAWNPATAFTLKETAGGSNVYTGLVDLNTTTPPVKFLITPEPDWDEKFGAGAGAGSLIANGADIEVPNNEVVELTADLNALSYTIARKNWALVGPATSLGWPTGPGGTAGQDLDFRYDMASKLYKLTVNLVVGPCKLRLNDDWTSNFGNPSGADGDPVATDGTPVAATQDGKNWGITVDGNYTITLDSKTGEVKFVKN